VVPHASNDKQGSVSPSVVGPVLEARNWLDAFVSFEPDLLTKFAQQRFTAVFGGFLAAARKPPAFGVAELYKHDSPAGRQCDAVYASGVRSGEEPDRPSKRLKAEDGEMEETGEQARTFALKIHLQRSPSPEMVKARPC
jgi:hypothetical protein